MVGCHNIGNSSSDSAANLVEQNQLQLILSKSVKEWTVCDGVTDDSKGLAKAFAAARNGAFTLDIDCPLYFHVGMDIARPIFIDNGTSVNFKGSGLIIVDNVFIPSFVIANSSNINLSNWKVKYTGGISVDERTGGYYNDGVWIPVSLDQQSPPAAFFAINLTSWLSSNRNIKFAQGVRTVWTGLLDPAAVFYLKGNAFNINITNMKLFVDEKTSADRFIPIAFSLNPGENNDQIFNAPAPLSKPYIATPHDIIFDNISLDGYYFGWHGSGQNITIKETNAFRYSDLQDSRGGNIGGLNLWFPPPHLFYFNTQPNWDHSLDNDNFIIDTTIDNGVRLGAARDKGGNSPISGHAVSLKMQGNNSLISNYTSNRPDGFMDVLSSNFLTVRNVIASYDSSFINYTLSALRFTQNGNHNIKFENISLTDNALFTYIHPINGKDDESNTNISFINAKINLKNWGEPKPPMYSPVVKDTTPYFGGTGHQFDFNTTYNGMVQTADIAVYNPNYVSYGNNTLRDILVGKFGLRTYEIKNNTSRTIYGLTFPSIWSLPSYMTYDDTRTTCNLNNQTILAPYASCNVVFKYQPLIKGVNSYFVLKIHGNDSFYETLSSDDIYVPYSSQY